MASPSSSTRFRPRIGITLGDINGIGPEVALKALWDVRLRKYADLVLIGSLHALGVHAAALRLNDRAMRTVDDLDDLDRLDESALRVIDVSDGRKPPVQFGRTDEIAGQIAMQAVERAVDLCLEGRLDAMVTAPISKQAIAEAGYRVPGHTEFIAARTRTEAYTMMMVTDTLRVGLVTTHIPIVEVASRITREAILEKIRIISASLSQDFGLPRPRLAVLGLNPHAGDGGVLGREEIQIIRPAIREASPDEQFVFGPFPADGFFGTGSYRHYDAVLAMYHDQGLVPFKALSFNRGVNFTAGLPIVRTSPDHGTAFDIAGQGKAEPESMRHAIYQAIDIARRRRDAPARS